MDASCRGTTDSASPDIFRVHRILCRQVRIKLVSAVEISWSVGISIKDCSFYLDMKTNMEIKSQETLASFTVESEAHELKQVLIIQDIYSLYLKHETYRKSYRLESIDGEFVYMTEDPNIFKLGNGAKLKRRTR